MVLVIEGRCTIYRFDFRVPFEPGSVGWGHVMDNQNKCQGVCVQEALQTRVDEPIMAKKTHLHLHMRIRMVVQHAPLRLPDDFALGGGGRSRNIRYGTELEAQISSACAFLRCCLAIAGSLRQGEPSTCRRGLPLYAAQSLGHASRFRAGCLIFSRWHSMRCFEVGACLSRHSRSPLQHRTTQSRRKVRVMSIQQETA